ncbi:RagB/SusD family nutrient uptake outer membrane protein [Parabacteroides sp. OttesenSCG-928-G06]|nr:RagB/SusD family nutrient uptake outer membrane protein [Parabacteroides sp. OttesenSCG-928-K15]MDL2282334.1 RagB/SusD family nutrient uptake outer membrane protein [Parabacteroides sp. OttesenSCG-928-G06]
MKNIKISLLILTLFISWGCQKDLMDTSPYDAIATGNMWLTENLADNGVNAIYHTLRSSNVGLGLYTIDRFGLSTDGKSAHALMANTIQTNNSLFSGYWQQHYEGIHRANDAIVNIPEKTPASEAKKGRLVAEAKFLRAYFYYKLNIMFKGVPLYLEPVGLQEMDRGCETEEKIWEVVLSDLSDCINEANLPTHYEKGDANVGRATKAAAYALRGKCYLWMKEWNKAEQDFKEVGKYHSLFQGEYKKLFKEENEQCPEMIFSVQCIGIDGLGNDMSFRLGSRIVYEQGWNTYLVSTDFVETYEFADGRKFNWDDVIPGYNVAPDDPDYTKKTRARSVYFLRDNMTDDEINAMKVYGADMSKYLPEGNEARIKKAYENRDPRLAATIITPYSEVLGSSNSVDYTYTLRWPYRGFDTAEPFDVRTDTNTKYYYLYRKFVAEGSNEIPNRSYSPIDFPLIRYADIVLNLAEALNEQNKMDEAITYVNMIRNRAGVAPLNSNDYTRVTDQADLRKRIQNERRWELNAEGVTFFDEMRWRTWEETKFFPRSGLKQIWGANEWEYTWSGDRVYQWPIPRAEREMNSNLRSTPGWSD